MTQKLLLGFFLFSAFFTPCVAEIMTFTGSAEIESFDVEAARNKACIDALLQAAKFIKTDLKGINQNQKYEAVYEEVVARTHGALKDIIFVKEIQLDTYFVAKIQCFVDESKLDEDGRVIPPDLSSLDVVEVPAAGRVLEATEKIANKLIQIIKTRQKENKKFTIALLPFGNQNGHLSEETSGYAEIIYGRLKRFLLQDPSFIVLSQKQLEVLAKENEILMDSFDKSDAHELVQQLGVNLVIVGRFDLFNLQDYKKADYFPTLIRLFFETQGDVTSILAEIRSEEKQHIGGTRLLSNKEAKRYLNRIRNLFDNPNFSFELLVDETPLEKIYIDSPRDSYMGYYFVKSIPGKSYTIKVTNKIYDKKQRRYAVMALINGKDSNYHKINDKWMPVSIHPQEASQRFLLEKEALIPGWKVDEEKIEPFVFEDASETSATSRLSIGSIIGSVKILIYAEILSTDQEGVTEALMEDGEAMKSGTKIDSLLVYPTPIAIYKLFYRDEEQYQVLKNQGVISSWKQLGTAAYEKQTPVFARNGIKYRKAHSQARKKAQKRIIRFLKKHNINYKYLKRKKPQFECKDENKVFVRIDYTVLELKEVLEPFNEKEPLRKFLNSLEEGIQSWGSTTLN